MIEVNESCGKHAYAAVISVVLNHRWYMPDRSCGESILDVQKCFIVSDALHSVCEVHGDGQRIVGDCMWTGVCNVVSHEKCPVRFRDVIRKEEEFAIKTRAVLEFQRASVVSGEGCIIIWLLDKREKGWREKVA